MNEEEKKALETLEFIKTIKFYNHAFDCGTEILDEYEKKAIDMTIYLIDKQQKQIIQRDMILDMYKNNYISKDKIRDLINKRNAGIGYTSLECIEDIEKLLDE